MKDAVTNAVLFALYHATVALGILLLPVALAVRRLGISLPAGQLVSRLTDAYESR